MSREHDILDVLARPVRIWSGKVTPSSFFVSAAVPDIWINSSQNVKDKLRGFTYLSGDLVARFAVNANPFQCGKYWLYYVPYSDVAGKVPFHDDIAHISAYPG